MYAVISLTEIFPLESTSTVLKALVSPASLLSMFSPKTDWKAALTPNASKVALIAPAESGIAVAELPGNLEADDQYRGLIDCPNFLRRAWRPSPIDHDLCSLLGAPSFSDAPSVSMRLTTRSSPVTAWRITLTRALGARLRGHGASDLVKNP